MIDGIQGTVYPRPKPLRPFSSVQHALDLLSMAVMGDIEYPMDQGSREAVNCVLTGLAWVLQLQGEKTAGLQTLLQILERKAREQGFDLGEPGTNN